MADLEAIVSQYTRNGWQLRRLLMPADRMAAAASLLPTGEAVRPSKLDAAWFSRPPGPGPIAWEMRYLGDIPFALLVHVDESSPDFEDMLAETEARLAAAISTKRTA